MLVLWVAVVAIASLVFRELGFARLKKYPLTILVLVACLASLPAAGVVKLAQPYRRRILALFRDERSPRLPATCAIFPANNVWNHSAAGLQADANSADYIRSIGGDLPLHPDFGPASGIPFTLTDGGGTPATVLLGSGAGESDRGPYIIPEDAPLEGSTDSHVLVLNTRQCVLYELFAAAHDAPGRWQAGSAAIFDLTSNRLRPAGWTSADAAGLPILPGLVRYDEVSSGRIAHALRFTARQTRRAYVWPARHYASYSTDRRLPPMGQRFRLRTSFDTASFSAEARVILTALKEYGMILADNGGSWFLSGAPDSRWPGGLAAEFRRVHGTDFEALDSTPLMLQPDSGEARQ